MSIEDMIRDMSARSRGCDRLPAISHLGQIARLREFKDRLDAGCLCKVGDLITPRKDAPIKNSGAPHLVVAIRGEPDFDFRVDEAGSQACGAAFDIRFVSFHTGSVVMHWGESVYFEPYTEAHEKADAERDYEDA